MTIPRLPQRRHTTLAAALCALAAAAVYSNTFTASFQLDDYLYVIDYSRTHALSDFWPPHGTRYLTYLTFYLNYSAGGLETWGYHAVNLLIHAANGLLVYLLAVSVMASPRLSGSALPAFPVALLASLIFVVHPVQTEAVTYISQRFASLATLLYLLAAVSYLRYRLAGRAGARAAFFAVALAATWASQVTKEISFTLPFVLVCLEAAFFTGPFLARLARLVPFLLAMAVIPWVLFGPGSAGPGVGGDVISLQLRDLAEISRHDYLVTQFRVMVTYLRLLVLPVGQTLEYDYPMYASLFVPGVLASFVFILFLFFGAVYLFLRFLKGASPFFAMISAGTLWFFTTISVESSIVPIKDLIFEHRLYLPMAGASVAVSSALFFAAGRLFPASGASKALIAACLVIVVPLGAAAWARNGVWKNEVTLYEDAVEKSPAKERARYNLAWAYHRGGQPDKAVEQYLESIRLNPGKDKAHYNLALIYRDMNEVGKAEQHFMEALRLSPGNPAGHYNLAMLYHINGNAGRAVEHYRRAIELKPDYEDAHYNLAMALMERGDFEGALSHLVSAVRINPGSADSLYHLGRAYAKTGDRRRASLALSEALRIRPGFAAARAELVNLEGGP